MPSIAGGKGWGDFNMLLDFGINTPTGDFHKLGTPLLTNAVLQYRVLKVIWPALEVNYTYWPNGPNRGKNQVFLLPEIILGSIELYGRVTWTIGAGYQFAVSHAHPQYENSWIVSFRPNCRARLGPGHLWECLLAGPPPPASLRSTSIHLSLPRPEYLHNT